MNIKEAWAHHERHSTKLSDVARQGALAGLALTWVFRSNGPNEPPAFGVFLLTGAMLLVLGLIADACQYATLSYNWEQYLKRKQHELQKQHPKEEALKIEFGVPHNVSRAGYVLFWTKATLIVFGLALVFAHIVTKLAGW